MVVRAILSGGMNEAHGPAGDGRHWPGHEGRSVKCFAGGADEYVSKPVDVDALLNRLTHIV